jgi:dihydrofolate reductase
MPELCARNIAISLDGYIAGPDQSLDNPLGVGGTRLHEWVFETRTLRQAEGKDGGTTDLDDERIAHADDGIGATIMGRNVFGPIRGGWDSEGPDTWTGWWGDEPPYHHDVSVLTHHAHDPIPMQGGTTFHFVTDGIESALERPSPPPRVATCASAAGPRPSSSTCRRGWSTRWRSSTCRSCRAGASGCSTTSTADPRA